MKTFCKNTCHRSTDIPEGVARRISIGFKRIHEDNGNLQTNKGAAAAWGMPNYMPNFNQGEDSFTVLAHVEELQRQYSLNKSRRNAALIKRLMDKTFPDHRNMLINEMSPIGEVIEKYPLLCCEEEARKSRKWAQFWIFTPHFAKFRAFRMLHLLKQHVFLEFLVEKKAFFINGIACGSTTCNKWLK